MLAGYNYKNLASITLQNAGLTTDTTITIPTSDASILPQIPFYATIMPVTQLANNSNSEIIIATGSTTSGTNTILSVTRAQRNTSAISWNAGEAVLTQAVYVEDIPNYVAGDGINIENEVISFDGGAETVSNTTPSSSFTLDTLSGSPLSLSVYGDTYQQTYSGKNLIGFSNVETGTSGTGNGVTYNLSNTKVLLNGTTTGSSNIIPRSSTNIYLPAGTYTVSFNKVAGSYSRPGVAATAFYVRTSGGSLLAEIFMNRIESGVATPITFRLTEETLIAIELYANAAGQIFNNFEFTVQIEAGSTATSYEPYVGGVPSPNPDYPQVINVVTGLQNVAVVGSGSDTQTFPIDLGSIELCKIRDYQDYIYRDGEDWYVHKEIGKVVLDGTQTFEWLSSTRRISVTYTELGTVFVGASVPYSYSDHFIRGDSSTLNNVFNFGGAALFVSNSSLTSKDAWTAWLAANHPNFYGVLVTPTDTKITDTTLISQLEAISLYTGVNAITVSSANLPALLLITSYANTINGKFRDVVWKGDTTSGVTQLKDQLGENIFPNLKDEQVTSAKIDFTTLLSQKYSFAASDFNASSANVTVLASGTEITIRTNPEKTLFEVYGRITTTATAVAETSVYIQTDLRPSQTMIITPAGFMAGVDSNGKLNGNIASQTMTIGTDGKMTFRSVNWADSSSQNRMTSFIFPTLTTVE